MMADAYKMRNLANFLKIKWLHVDIQA